ncbi:MAG TPA: hypothetical protein VG733_07425 [Chthoniobacteraceae bacterium]|nr:hypothetical protein [Chthoniobacteraceae bacterium]
MKPVPEASQSKRGWISIRKWVVVVAALAIANFALWHFLFGGYTIHLDQGYSLTIYDYASYDDFAEPSYSVKYTLDGPGVHTNKLHLAFVERRMPNCSVHTTRDGRLTWLTPNTQPLNVIFILDHQTGAWWPAENFGGEKDRLNGPRMLDIINAENPIYHLNENDWIDCSSITGEPEH